MMTPRLRTIAVGILVWVFVAAAASGLANMPPTQVSNGRISGHVVDSSIAPVPGVTVTLEGPALIRPLVAVTEVSGKYQFPIVPIGTYTVRFELTGFKKIARAGVVVGTGMQVIVSAILEVGELSETVEVSGAAPIVDTRTSSTGATFNREVMGSVPTARDPWQIVNSAAGVGGGINAGGNLSGQQVRFTTVTKMAATGTESYAAVRPNPFNLTSVAPMSTFAADVDTASFTNVRRFLNDGALPPADAVRVEEFINYFHYAYPDPSGDHPVSVTTEVGAAPWAPDHRLVLVGIKAQPIEQREVARRNIVLLIDVSGSMSSSDKLPLVKTGLRMFVDTLRDDDRIAIAVYAGASGLVLPSTPARQRARIHDAIEKLHAGGSTNGAQGIQLAYKVAEDEFVRGGINRVILATDGDFNVGVTSQSDLLHLIEEKKKGGVFLSVLGVGTGNLKDSTMEMIADKGNGHYAYLDSLQQARRVLVEEGGATLETVAKDVKFQVEFNPATVAGWRLIGYENRLLAHQDFNDDTKDGGELGAGHTVTVLYEVVPVGVELPDELKPAGDRPVVDELVYQERVRPSGNRRDLLMVKVRYKQPDEDESSLLTRPVRDEGRTTILPFAASVAEFALLLRDPEADSERWTRLAAQVAALDVERGQAADHREFVSLVELAASLRRLGNR